jgi:nitroreductase
LIIEAGVYAPTAHNEQPWHFTIIQNQEILQHINERVREFMAKSDGIIGDGSYFSTFLAIY